MVNTNRQEVTLFGIIRFISSSIKRQQMECQVMQMENPTLRSATNRLLLVIKSDVPRVTYRRTDIGKMYQARFRNISQQFLHQRYSKQQIIVQQGHPVLCRSDALHYPLGPVRNNHHQNER
jgi:hypothetical protein